MPPSDPTDAGPTLTVAAGPDAGAVFALTGPVVAVGRHSGAAVRLTDEQVSRNHLELRLTITGHRLHDLGSGNGTRVNGAAVQSADLGPGDRVELGGTVLVYAGRASARPGPAVVVRAAGDQPSAVLRSVPGEAGSELLRDPAGAGTDWLRGRLAALAALYAAADATAHILDLDELLGRLMDLALKTADADHGVVLLADSDTGELVPTAARRRGGGGGGPLVVSRTVVDHVLAEGRAVLVADAAADERFGRQASVAAHGLREVICAPMRGRHGTVGALFLDTTGAGGRRFTDDHLTLAAALAHQAALAVEETRYYHAMVQSERLAAVGQAMAALSHHVKNIMQGVRFGSDLVRMGLTQDDRELLGKGWRLVERNQAKIDDLILDMLSYSKEREPAADPTDLNGVASEVLDVVRGRAGETGIELTLVPGELPLVPCDADGVSRALLNVVSNAVDAVAECDVKRVTVTTRIIDGWAEIAVTDTGAGVDLARVEELFKPFVSTKGSRGTGLGLPSSRKTLREHGGDVTAAPADGGGSVFTLRLPLVSAECGVRSAE